MESWIRKAFEDAEERSREWMIAEEWAEKFLKQNVEDIVVEFLKTEPEYVRAKFYMVISDDEMLDVIMNLIGGFLFAGFLNGMYNSREED